jgi:7,8-dihydropterin-6-yl-methyl-4-(beta-D-ribofuranosyl)aminobenzene 5'-phosphate synthase
MTDHITLLPVEAADVTILVDNFIDILLPGTEMVQRPPFVWDWSEREQLIAEHGYSLLLTVQREGRTESVLYDAGLGRNTVLHNIDVLDVGENDLRAFFIR